MARRCGADRPAPTRELGAYRANSEEGIWFGHSVRVTPRDECRPLAKSAGDPSGVGYYFYFFCVRLREREGRSYSTRANPKRVASDRAETHRKRAANTRRTRAARRPSVEGSRWTRAATSTRAVLQR
jgi:hypothetical protein